MGNGFLDRVEDNAAVRIWAEMTQHEKGDSFAEGYVSKLWDFTRVNITQNNLQDLKEIWEQWNNKLLHIREGRFVVYNRRIHGFTLVFEDSSR
ncbi:hypothetical protein Golax_025737 [Gossypium laxum]|uniref:Uncharacterized protein n=1 Tax=Gossypium laxum TaxID=34288 RepID=A0A7J9B0C9_9ROSI|nr:hypothetical protein [Gossypium laxum]